MANWESALTPRSLTRISKGSQHWRKFGSKADRCEIFLNSQCEMWIFKCLSITRLSAMTVNLQELLNGRSVFKSTPSHKYAFDMVRNAINEEGTLAYYDPTKEGTFLVDASIKGFRDSLLQDKKPTAFASKALTDAESQYADIKRELLNVVYGCDWFHPFLYGQSIVTGNAECWCIIKAITWCEDCFVCVCPWSPMCACREFNWTLPKTELCCSWGRQV